MTDNQEHTDSASSNTVCFDSYTFDPDSRELRLDGDLVPLEPKVFALLLYLIEQRHRAVDKDEIQDTVWAGTIVSETALTRAIMKARRAVGDSADEQKVIRTVHGHGYQFIAPLSDRESRDTAAISESTSNRLRLIGVAFVLTLMGFIAYLWPDTPDIDNVRLAIMPVENLTGDTEYDWTRLGLMGFAGELIAQSDELSVMRASDAIRFAETNGLPDDDSAANDLATLQQVYGASHLLRTRLEQNAGTLRLSYSLHAAGGDIERGTMVGSEPILLLKGMVRKVAATLDDDAVSADAVTVIAEDAFINEAYSRALAFSLEGRCKDALQLFEVVKSATGEITRADYEWANCARVLGRWQEAEAAFSDILDALPEEPATSLRALAHQGLGTVYIRTGRGDEAQATLEAGLDVARQAGDRIAQGMILNNLAINAKDRREHDEARSLIARATVAYTEAKHGILPGQLPAALANIDMAEGKLDLAEQHLSQALESFRATGDRRNEAMMLNNFGYLRRIQGRINEAEPLHLESLAIRREIGDHVGQGRILGMLSVLYANEGRLDDAKTAAIEAHEIASEANDHLFMATSMAQLGQAQASAGELNAARESYADAKAIFEGIEDISRAAQVTVRLARIDIETGDLKSAQARVDEVIRLGRSEALHEPLIEAMELDGDIAGIAGDPQRAIEALRRTLDEIDETGIVVTRTRVMVKLLSLLLDTNELADAEPLIGYLIEAGDSAATLRVRARYAYLKGDANSAIELLNTLRTDFSSEWTPQDSELEKSYRGD